MAPPLQNIDWIALGARLQEARKASGLKQEDVAKELNMVRTTLVAIEKGQRRLEPSELVRLAKLYKLEVNALLRDRPPAGSLAVQFKAMFKRELFKTVHEDEVEKATALLQRHAEDYLELEGLLNSPLSKRYPAEYPLDGGIPIEVLADAVASQERSRLGLGDGPISNLRSMIENEVGLRIFFLPLNSKIAGLFGFTEELGGCIAINSKHPPERRRLSLAHEYAHFLTQRFRPDIQVFRSYERMPESERFAEAFARRFLMPESGLLRQLRARLQASKGKLLVSDLVDLAHYYRVSFEAYVRRLEELSLVPMGTFDSLKGEGFKVNQAKIQLDLEVDQTSDVRLPERFSLLAVEAHLKDLITEGRLAQYLSVSRLEAREVVDNLSGQDAVNEEGVQGWLPWNVEENVQVRSR
jgi:Zn-dependent peptidase ImmA (M78 family)/DNA-binding XRE family transcriptional regulator